MKFKMNLMHACSKKDVLLMSILFIFLFLIYEYLTLRSFYSDMPTHAWFSRVIAEGRSPYTGNFILYGLINFFTYCYMSIITPIEPFLVAVHCLCLLLAWATTYKFRLVYNHLDTSIIEWKKILIALSLLLVAAIPIPSIFITGKWYVGNFMPNIWHNSTTIFLFPFAIILFHLSIKQIEEFSPRRNLWLLLLVFLNIFIKPSYFFVWVAIYPLFLLIKHGLTLKFLKGLMPVITGIALLLLQYLYIYYTDSIYDKSTILIKPFQGYACFAPPYMIPLAFLSSLLYPVLYFVLNFKRLSKNMIFLFAYASLFVAIVIFMLFVETGIRTCHGNFSWQVIICTWLCFYVSVLDWFKNRKQLMHGKNKRILYVCNATYLIHVIVGIIYLERCLFVNCF